MFIDIILLYNFFSYYIPLFFIYLVVEKMERISDLN